MTTLRVHIAELAISDEPAVSDGIAAEVVSNRTTAAGHSIAARSEVGNDEATIREQLVAWIADPKIDVVIAITTDPNKWLAAVAPLGAPRSFAGPRVAGTHFIQCKTTSVFVVPGATSSVIEAMDNVVAEMTRLAAELSSARPAAVAAVDAAVASPALAAVPSTAAPTPSQVAAAEPTAASRRRTQPPPPPADKRVSTPPPLPVREDVVSTSEIVAIADAPPPLAREDVVSTSEIVAIADAPPPPRRTTPPPLPRAFDDDQSVAGAVLLAPRRNRMPLGRWIAVALLAGATGFGVTAWILRDSRGSRNATTGETAAVPTAVAIEPTEEPTRAEPDAPIPEVVVEVSGSRETAKPTSGQTGQSAHVAKPNPSADPEPSNRAVENAGSAGVRGTPDDTGKSPTGQEAVRMAKSDVCSEEACVLDNPGSAGMRSTPGKGVRSWIDPAPPCCERYRPRAGVEKPTELARWMVKAGVEQVKPRVVACGEKIAAKGTVKIAVKVAPDGSVAEAVVAESPNAELGQCVEAAIRSGKFAKTATGGTFRYPFVF